MHVQEKVQAEIDSVVGSSREVSLDDEKNLPYTQATILELMRRHTVAYLGLPHCALKDTEIQGYFLPASTTVITNLYSAHMDPTVWAEPEIFRPERFLDENGKIFGKERMISFSMGKRTCIGEQLARQEMFLICSSLVKHFKILPPKDKQKVEFEERVFLTTTPTPFFVRMIPRVEQEKLE